MIISTITSMLTFGRSRKVEPLRFVRDGRKKIYNFLEFCLLECLCMNAFALFLSSFNLDFYRCSLHTAE